MEFTVEQQAHINNMIKQEKEKWVTDELNPLQTQIAELKQYKPKDKTEQEIAFEKKEKELWNKEKMLTLKENNLDKFADFIHGDNVENLQKAVDSFKNVFKELKIDNSFIPQEHKKSNKTEYEKHEKDGNTLGMISSKLNKLFGN